MAVWQSVGRTLNEVRLIPGPMLWAGCSALAQASCSRYWLIKIVFSRKFCARLLKSRFLLDSATGGCNSRIAGLRVRSSVASGTCL